MKIVAKRMGKYRFTLFVLFVLLVLGAAVSLLHGSIVYALVCSASAFLSLAYGLGPRIDKNQIAEVAISESLSKLAYYIVVLLTLLTLGYIAFIKYGVSIA